MEVGDIISFYKQKCNHVGAGKSIEFEVRFKDITKDDFSRIFNKLSTNIDVKYTETMNIILPESQVEIINTHIFVDGIKQGEILSQKKQLRQMKDFQRAFKIAVSEEMESKRRISLNTDGQNVFIRFKRRASLQYDSWSADLTLVRVLHGATGKDTLIKIRDSFFPKNVVLTKENFLTDADKYEVEFEYKSDPPLLSTTVFTRLINEVLPTINPNMTVSSKINETVKRIMIILRLRRTVESITFKNILPNATILTWELLRQINTSDEWKVTLKADGIRCVVILEEHSIAYVTNESYITETISDKIFKLTILDGELIDDVFYAFDAITVEGNEIAFQKLPQRLDAMENYINTLDNPKIRMKQFVPNDPEKISTMMSQTEFPTDGLVFVKCDQNYNNTTWAKWKPIEKITTDFLVRKAPKSSEFIPKPKTTVYYLFVTQYSSDITRIPKCKEYSELFPESFGSTYPIQFAHVSNPDSYVYYHPKDAEDIDGKICEFAYINGAWQLVKIRTDRELDLKTKNYFGNSLKVAISNFDAIFNPITIETLLKGAVKSQPYFSKEKSTIYRYQTQYISEVKEMSIMSCSGAKSIIDLGIGKGQDLFRYVRKLDSLEQLIGVDADAAAIAEASDRIKTSDQKINFVVSFLVGDFTTREIIEQIKPQMKYETVDVVISHLSFHYCASSVSMIDIFANNCVSLLADNGYVRIISPFGEEVLKLFKDYKISMGESWRVLEKDILKYEIKRGFEEDYLTDAGQKISVLLPFSNGELYDEYLVNSEAVIKIFEMHNLFLISKKSLTEFKTRAESRLTLDDKKYISLYGELVFQKRKIAKTGSAQKQMPKRIPLIPSTRKK
jgi:23S rRNA U2552 (ribose-2'-O)-methylase RlmE/FtsJ